MALEGENSTINSQASRKTYQRSGMNEAEALAAEKIGEGSATESHRYLPELNMARMLRRQAYERRCESGGRVAVEREGSAGAGGLARLPLFSSQTAF